MPAAARSHPDHTEPTYDCVIVGGGPAGLSAAVYMGRFRRQTLLIDSGDGRWAYGQRNENYLGFPQGVSARRLHTLGVAQARRFGVEPRHGRVDGIQQLTGDHGFRLSTSEGPMRARTVIWAAGVRDRWPDFRGARQLVGKLLFWCIVCDGWRTQDKRLLLLGDDDAAAEDALQFLTYTSDVTLLIHQGRDLVTPAAHAKLTREGVKVLYGQVRGVRLSGGRGERAVECVRLQGGRELHADLIFSLYGADPNTELLRALPVQLTPRGLVNVNSKYQTSLPRFYAAGDVTNHHSDQIAAAVHGGSQAAQAANFILYPPRQRLPTKERQDGKR